MPGSEPSATAAAPSLARGRVKYFLTLPLEIRNKIYRHLFVFSHPIYIFQDCPNLGNIESFMPDISSRRRRWTALLYVNRQVSIETRTILYGANQFQLMELSIRQPKSQNASLLKSFLECIGPVNARLLSRLCMQAPTIEERIEQDSSGGRQSTRQIRIKEDDRQKLQLLQRDCTGLRVLDMIFTGSGLSATGAEVTQEVLQEIDTHFRAIPSLSSITIRVLDRRLHPSARAMDIMQQLGWIVVLGER